MNMESVRDEIHGYSLIGTHNEWSLDNERFLDDEQSLFYNKTNFVQIL